MKIAVAAKMPARWFAMKNTPSGPSSSASFRNGFRRGAEGAMAWCFTLMGSSWYTEAELRSLPWHVHVHQHQKQGSRKAPRRIEGADRPGHDRSASRASAQGAGAP